MLGMDPHAAGLLGRVAALLAKDPRALDVRPVISAHGHEVEAVQVTTAEGVFELRCTSARD